MLIWKGNCAEPHSKRNRKARSQALTRRESCRENC